jgi:hypothetical protein
LAGGVLHDETRIVMLLDDPRWREADGHATMIAWAVRVSGHFASVALMGVARIEEHPADSSFCPCSSEPSAPTEERTSRKVRCLSSTAVWPPFRVAAIFGK